MTEEAKLFVIRALRPPIYGETVHDMSDRLRKAATLIESLSAQLDHVTRERDAAVEQLKEADANKLFWCDHCKYEGTCIMSPCNSCVNQSNWQWRGVEKEVEG